jgi:hypothetical protein
MLPPEKQTVDLTPSDYSPDYLLGIRDIAP